MKAILNGSKLPAVAPLSLILMLGSASVSAATENTVELQSTKIESSPLRADQDSWVTQQSSAGSKINTDLSKVPQSVSVVGREQMNKQRARTVMESLKYTPGVFADSRADGLFDGLFIRGFGGFGGLANFDKKLDGLPLRSGQYLAGPTLDAYLLERVELLKGPASVLYGQASPGGVVNLVSKQPVLEPLHSVELQTGNHGERQIGIDLGGALDDQGIWSYRVAGISRRADTQIDHTEEQRIAIAPSLRWQPDDDTSLTLLTSYQKDPSSYYTGWVPAEGSVLKNANGKISRHFNPGEPSLDSYDREQSMVGYQFEHRFDDVWTFRQHTRYLYLESEYKGYMVNYVDPWASATELNRLLDHSVEDQQTLSLDNQLQAEFETGLFKHTMLMGLEVSRGRSSMKLGRSYAVSGIDYLNPQYGSVSALPEVASNIVQTNTQGGAYWQDQIEWDKWNFLVGLRQDWVTTKTDDHLGDTHSSQSDDHLTGRVGLIYNFDNGISPYASYSTSFESVTGVDAQSQAFTPMKGEQYEIGVKYQPTGWNSFVTVSAFDITQKNVRTSDPNNAFYYVQTGEVRVRGAELEAHARVADNLSLILGYTVLDPEVTKDTSAQVEGNRPVSVPLNQASAWADYDFSGALRGFSAGVGVRHVGKSYGDTANNLSLDAYNLVDAALRVDLSKFVSELQGISVALDVKNLNDKHYVASCFSAGGCFYGPERTSLLSLKYDW